MTNKRSLVLAGASSVGRGTPWGTLCEVVAAAITPLGYECRIEQRSWGPDNGRWVADGRADIGGWHITHMINAYRGIADYAAEGPRDNLRVIAHINHPVWLGIAVKSGAGIERLEQIASERRPVRIRSGRGRIIEIVLDHCGLSKEQLVSFGGSLKPAHEVHGDPVTAPVVEPELVEWVTRGDFDVIIDAIYSGFPPEIPHWPQASIQHDLVFLPLAPELVAKIVDEGLGTPGFIPHRLLRGLWYDVPSVRRLPQAVYCRAETPNELVHDVAAALDQRHDLFRQCHLNYQYDPANVAVDLGVPLHPAALAYYESAGIPTTADPASNVKAARS